VREIVVVVFGMSERFGDIETCILHAKNLSNLFPTPAELSFVGE